MKIGARAKLVLLLSLFALPIVASLFVYRFAPPSPTANYGELLLPPVEAPVRELARADGGKFAFGQLAGKWIMVVSDSGACAGECAAKLSVMAQVRLALGRNAGRVERVMVVDDGRRPDVAGSHFAGVGVALVPAGAALPPGAGNDRGHIYLVDPRGNVMLRWPAAPDRRRMLKDLERLLKASQIG